MPITCAYHPEREPVGNCVACGRFICADCKALLGDKLYCTACANKIFVQNQAVASKPADPVPPAAPTYAPPAYVPPYSPPAYTPPPTYAPPQSSTLSPSNTSSVNINLTQTMPVAPAAEVAMAPKGWNWGAAVFQWIWGIFNGVWISFLGLLFAPIMFFVLGIKGNQWAWEKKGWNNVEDFKRAQRPWNIAGVILFILGLVGGVIWLIIFIVAMAGIATVGFDTGF